MNRLAHCLAAALLLAAPALADAKPRREPPLKPLGTRPALVAFANELAAAEGWNAAALRRQLAAARHLPKVRQLILPASAPSAKNWGAYRDRFVEPARIEAGLAFWRQHEDALARAQARWGVPAEVVVGIVGVETYYGRITGGFKVLDALATLAFDFPAAHPRAAERQAFFRAELAEFLRLTREQGLAPEDVRGSYAGALGWPQFMPGSWRKYAVDFDGDGHINLMASPVDAIGSVAHYLAAFGWQAGQPTHYDITLPEDPAARARLLAPDIKPSFSAAELQAAGATLPEAARSHAGPLAVIELQNGGQATTPLLGTQNFWVVTRYNWSAYYALGVIELGQAVARARTAAQAAPQQAAQ
ncbi:lytic murein transglycosylase B [Pelomonas sp. UHG3]|uniref:Lytic murein transglycosylase B n=1 Tax=Roseateles hydrophilus TaxID=2975054 RepID=A0ACC6C6J3_9BURK|nr:lytic murein transglycosylase B [Pelomonas sp. UHG3]MCY4744047.1 lytic murein transglycosylase B [Pelomonas sp. UHG3]